jgi:hypothetical protein
MRNPPLAYPLIFIIFVFVSEATNQSAFSQSMNDNAYAHNVDLFVSRSVAEIRTNKAAQVRTDGTMRLALFLDANPSPVDNNSLENITTLLSDNEDSVRFWAAAALGRIGPPASASVPELRRAFDSHHFDPRFVMTSADAICTALKNIEGTLTPEDEARCKLH